MTQPLDDRERRNAAGPKVKPFGLLFLFIQGMSFDPHLASGSCFGTRDDKGRKGVGKLLKAFYS